MIAPQTFDITFKIIEFDQERDILVVQCHSSVLKNPPEFYPEINIGTRRINFEGDVKEQIMYQCHGLISEWYRNENKDSEKVKDGIAFVKDNLLKTITIEADNNENISGIVPSPVSKIRFI